MSLNRILNRPMFRREALRKGHLIPIKARVGRSFIGPMQPPVPAVIPKGTPLGVPVGPSYNYGLALRAQPTFLERMGTGAKSLGRGLFSIPSIGGFYAGDKVAQAMGINDPIGRTAMGFGGSYLATKALPGLASLPGAVSAGLIAGPAYLMYAGSKERERIKNMSPEERAAHKSKSMQFGMSYLDDDQFNQQFGPVDPSKLDEIVKKPRTTIPDPGSGRVGSKRFKQKQEDVATAPDNVTKFGKTEVIDTAKIAENTIPNIDSGRGGDSASALARQNAMPPPEGQDPKQDPPKDDPKEDPKGKGDPNLDTINANSPFKAQLDLARLIAKEMRQGQTSQAKMVFLSNLASGLLTGTTRKAGLGGALEVFGAALGPAVNNMVMVKMKEDEIEQNLLGKALEFSTDYLKAQNQAFEMPDTKEIGVIQFTDENGKLTNVVGRQLKDGTMQFDTGLVDSNGLKVYKTFEGTAGTFIANKDMNKETLEIAGDLAGKYGALNLINRSLGTILRGDAQAGAVGAVGLYGGRLTNALGDVFNFVKPGGDNAAQIRSSGRAMFELERNKAANRLINSGEFEDKKEALKYLNKQFGTFEQIRRNYLSDAKKRLKGGSTLDYERLAINETVLVYKLANSLKSKDRLTQKDIEMAKGLVKVFPLLRGEDNVIASLQATAETILEDIRQMENQYLKAGGASSYLENQRKEYGVDVRPLEGTSQLGTRFQDLQKLPLDELEELFKGFGGPTGQTGKSSQRG